MLDNYNLGLDMEFIPLFIKNTPLICSLTGVFLAIF
jgi:hypothetical protein